jgi:DNA-binding response OmpR family regulator
MKLLLVEDDDAISDSLIPALRSASYIVERARGGDHAKILANTSLYDLIILDLICRI